MNAASLLLPCSFLLLFAAALGLHVAARSRQLVKRRNERFRAALDRHERMSFVDLVESDGLATKPARDTRASPISRVFGYDAQRLDLYPLHPVTVVGIALPLAALVAGATTLVAGRAGLLLTVPLWPIAARMLFGRWKRKRASTLFEQFPDALAMVVRGVRVGIPVGDAIASVSRDGPPPTAIEFGLVVDQLAIGLPLDEALRMMGERNGLPEYRFFATALSLQSQTGGNLGETLEGLADTIRKRVAARSRGYALAAEARTSANVLTVLPVLLFIALWFMNPRYVMTLLTEPTGHIILGFTLGLLGLGVLSMRMMIQKSLS
ncbi:type II secretion system protein F [Lichenicola cladoniae]|uniref:Type II secretion system protein F n=1 Tax=Lichenicola cladoniae TaxID=1484109 RepID=A0A6M8GZF8_9PROT|nr:type II secretion system F family protein [Lichenicola cladoniae]NPD69197.1 type II secretion system protein F [Acetobacteraceae bacterium]QKE89024.1 type II secretion system protein F [Lichenicola cladoniae]